MGNEIHFHQIGKTVNTADLLQTLKPHKNDLVFIAGSLVEGLNNPYSKGMGNNLSDIDIFVLRSKLAEIEISTSGYDYASTKIDFKPFQGIGIDIEYYFREDIEDLIRQFNAIDFQDCDKNTRLRSWIKLPQGILLDGFMSLLHRMYYGIPIYNIEGVEQIRKSINYENYLIYNAQYYIQKMDNRYDDVLGNLDNGDSYVACAEAREMLTYCMAAYVFSKGESLDRPKWIPLRLKNIAALDKTSEKIYKQYFKLMFKSDLSNEAFCKSYVEDIINLTEYAVSNVRKNLKL